jgi:4-amino-4-deoxy-L-arabinose transferase-like glycosyltransferase
VAFVATTGGLPELRPGDWDSALLERLKTGTLQPGDSVASIRYESWQPPVFYLLAAPVYLIGGTDEPSTVVLRLRLFNVLLGSMTVVIGYLVAREALSPLHAVAVPLTMAGVPMFTAVSAGLSADPLANLLSAAILLALIRGRGPIATGGLLGLGLLTKLALAIFLPIAIVAIARRATRPVREAAIAFVVALVLTAPWLVHQVTTYGWTDPLATARHASVVADQPRFPGFEPSYVSQFLTVTFHSFFAQFGWMAIVAPDRLYWIWGALALLAGMGLVISRRCFREPVWQLLVGTIAAAVLAYVGYNLSFEQFQGRYLFTALVPIAILLVAGWAGLFPRRLKSATIAVPVFLVALNGYTLLRVLVPGFAPLP